MADFVETLRRIDDADLDVYQSRLLLHIWRVGECWEGVESLSTKCHMSVGKVSQVRRWLLDNGWINPITARNGRAAVALAETQIPQSGNGVSPYETGISLYETRVSPHETEVYLRSKPNEAVPVNGDGISAIEELVNHFLAVSHCKPPDSARGDYADNWVKPMVAIYQEAADFQETKERVSRAVKILRDGKYPVNTPKSIQNTAVNIRLGEQKSGEVGFR